jgi:type IV pilus assembly protein PilV
VKRAPRSGRGFTVIEVMMGLAVLTIGSLTVVSMQKATLIANTNARNLAAATEVAQAWIERLRVDALAWNNPGGNPDITTDTVWLKNVNTIGWFSPATSIYTNAFPAGAPGADVMGADIFSGDPSATAFCVQARLLQYGQQPALWALARLVRAEVRVYWDKTGAPVNCATAQTGALPSNYGAVYLVSGVLENNSPY